MKGKHQRQFAHEARTACDKNGYVLEAVVTSGNVRDSVAFNDVYDKVTQIFPEIETIVADSAYKTPHSTTNRDGYREYCSDPKICAQCPTRQLCTHSKNCAKPSCGISGKTMRSWPTTPDTPRNTKIFMPDAKTIERVFTDAKEKHGMRYTHYRGLAQVSNWVRLKFAAMNLEKLARRKAKRRSGLSSPLPFARTFHCGLPGLVSGRPLFDKLRRSAFSGHLKFVGTK